jgi:hypothetical protein
MAKIDTLFKSAGVCTHSNGSITVNKVRYGTDYVRRVKLLSTPGNVKVRGAALDPVRVSLIELPEPMDKMAALKFIQAHADFQSAEDQAMISDEITERTPAAPRVAKATKVAKVKVSKKSAPSLDSIKSRARKSKATASDVLAAVAESQEPAQV